LAILGAAGTEFCGTIFKGAGGDNATVLTCCLGGGLTFGAAGTAGATGTGRAGAANLGGGGAVTAFGGANTFGGVRGRIFRPTDAGLRRAVRNGLLIALRVFLVLLVTRRLAALGGRNTIPPVFDDDLPEEIIGNLGAGAEYVFAGTADAPGTPRSTCGMFGARPKESMML
tara:strand:- start:63926 stop:64438 length:513 start_codon:yes stop_codon:yes gene_type:complete